MKLYLDSQGNSPHRLAILAAQCAAARLVLDRADRHTDHATDEFGLVGGAVGYLTLADVALLAVMDERSVRNAADSTLPNPLIVDGARRLITDERVRATAARLGAGVVCLNELTVKVVAKTVDELKAVKASMSSRAKSAEDATGSDAASAVVAGGGAIAAGKVTILGSKAIGGAALSLGLISAPAWPVVAGGVVALAGYAAWKAVRHVGSKSSRRARHKGAASVEGVTAGTPKGAVS